VSHGKETTDSVEIFSSITILKIRVLHLSFILRPPVKVGNQTKVECRIETQNQGLLFCAAVASNKKTAKWAAAKEALRKARQLKLFP